MRRIVVDMPKLLNHIQEVMETNLYEVVNEKINEDWILLHIVPQSGKMLYVLGRMEID